MNKENCSFTLENKYTEKTSTSSTTQTNLRSFHYRKKKIDEVFTLFNECQIDISKPVDKDLINRLENLLCDITKILDDDYVDKLTPYFEKQKDALEKFLEFPDKFKNQNLNEKWTELVKIRDICNISIEEKRASKEIGSSLEASLKIELNQKLKNILVRPTPPWGPMPPPQPVRNTLKVRFKD